MSITILVFLILVILIVSILFLIIARYFSLWLRAVLAKTPVSFHHLLAMSLRKVKPDVIVNSIIMAKQAGMDLDANVLEAHYLAGGNVGRVAAALVTSAKSGKELTFEQACIIDLNGHDVLEAVRTNSVDDIINDLQR